MAEDIVKIKSGKGVLHINFPKEATFSDVRANLEEKLISGSGFFLRGTVVLLPRDVFSPEENEALQKLFHAHGLICRTKTPEEAELLISNAAAKEQQPQTPSKQDIQEMLVINKTLRGGQEIRTESSVLIVGNVNPGAQIISGGSIDIRGTCRGMVHAGATGDTAAIIVADHLMPTQIRIANLIARSPDAIEKSNRAERASIKDGRIIIEPIER